MDGDVKFKNLAMGGVLATLQDILIDLPLDAAGLYRTWSIRDGGGNYIIGLGTGDLITIGTGAAMYGVGRKKRSELLQTFGLGYMLALGLIKLGEIYGYVWNHLWKGLPTTLDPKSPKNACPVCGTKLGPVAAGVDVKCPHCGFVSAWTRK